MRSKHAQLEAAKAERKRADRMQEILKDRDQWLRTSELLAAA